MSKHQFSDQMTISVSELCFTAFSSGYGWEQALNSAFTSRLVSGLP